MKVRFIAHAGFCVEEGDTRLMLDPWFFSSTFEEPLMYSILPPHKTIDFQIPNTREKIEDFKAVGALVSHFHTHHAPAKEMRHLIDQCPSEEFTLAVPALNSTAMVSVRANLGPRQRPYRIVPINGAQLTFQLGPFSISGFPSTILQHAIWLVQSATGSFLHIADAQVSRNSMDRRLDRLWYQFEDLKPDLMVMSAGSHVTRMTSEGKPYLYENSMLSPSEAARLTALVKPKTAAVMGVFNHSSWTNRSEWSLPGSYAEDEFRWALEHLDPGIRCEILRPGREFSIESQRQIRCFQAPAIESLQDLFN